jgi:hypothetical protein
MKKILWILALLLLIPSICFASAATVVQTEYGYVITGGTDATLVPQDTWVTATAYKVGQKVSQTGHLYKCLFAHTSGTFATDLTAMDWVKIGECTLWLGGAILDPVGAATDKALFTSGQSDVAAFRLTQYMPAYTFPSTESNKSQGVALTNLKITLSATTDYVFLFVNMDNFTTN